MEHYLAPAAGTLRTQEFIVFQVRGDARGLFAALSAQLQSRPSLPWLSHYLRSSRKLGFRYTRFSETEVRERAGIVAPALSPAIFHTVATSRRGRSGSGCREALLYNIHPPHPDDRDRLLQRLVVAGLLAGLQGLVNVAPNRPLFSRTGARC